MLDRITPVILTHDEAPNIRRCLDNLKWARDIVVLDSFSGDETGAICGSFPQVRLFSRAFDSHAAQWTYAVNETGIGTDWILALDADYMVGEAAIAEMASLAPAPDTSGYRASFDLVVLGRRLRSAIYPPVTVLFRRDGARYVQDGHTQRLVADGDVLPLHARLDHDDRKSLERWARSQIAYARLEADKLRRSQKPGPQRWLRVVPLSPLLVPLYCLILRGGIRDGRAGLYYALQRGIAEALICLFYLDARFRNSRS